MPSRPDKPRYQPHPMLARERKAMDKLAKDTGRTYDDWVRVARADGPGSRKELVDWLRTEHGHAKMNASWIAGSALSEDTGYEEPEPLVDALYSGPRAALRPVHERAVDAVLALGDDVVVTACKTMVPVYRKHVFAELRPADGAVELHLALGAAAPAGASARLSPATGRQPGERLTHRVLLRSARDVDRELRGWLAQAYEAGAGKVARPVGEAAVPDDLAGALAASAPAQATWASCTAAMRRDFVAFVESAKQAETRARRVAQCAEKLAAGKKRVY
jgi:hypothetical protein